MSGTMARRPSMSRHFPAGIASNRTVNNSPKPSVSLSYWTLTCMTVDPEDPRRSMPAPNTPGLFYTKDAGAHWHRADPQVPKMFLYSALAIDGGVMVGTIPSAVYRSKNGGWEELGRRALAQRRRQFSAESGTAVAHALSRLRAGK